jgi:hypothetical protein
MAHRASPPRIVGAFTKTTVAAAEAAPSAEGDFVNIERSTIRHEDGFAQGEFAILPDKHDYDNLRFIPRATALGAVTEATITIWVRLSDGNVVPFGTSELGADGSFPPIEGENYQGTYAATVSHVATTGDGVSATVAVQGVHVGYLA